MSGTDDLYDDHYVAFLEAIWGEGYLSPGGPQEVALILRDLEIENTKILDIGCGSGAIALSLVTDHGAGHVIGIDVEAPVCAAARRRVEAAGAGDKVTIRKVEPGPFDFPDTQFDVVFSKDSIIHIPDKEFLADEIYRVLRPGGWFAASDWLISHDGEPSPEMVRYVALEDLDFAMASPANYAKALAKAGFVDIQFTNRNPWYREVAKEELALMSGPKRSEFEADHGVEFVAHSIELWRAMLTVLETGEHCPHHVRGRKPT